MPRTKLTEEEEAIIEEMMVDLEKELDILEEEGIRKAYEPPPYPDLPEDDEPEDGEQHMPSNRLLISLKREPAMELTRIAIRNKKLVYVICANRKLPYPNGRSPIAYIGTTKLGIGRIAASAAYHSEDILGLYGVNSFQVRIVTCGGLHGVKTWRKLERALLLEFRKRYGSVPLCNTVGNGKGYVETNEFDFFARKRVRDILHNLAESGVAPEHVISE